MRTKLDLPILFDRYVQEKTTQTGETSHHISAYPGHPEFRPRNHERAGLMLGRALADNAGSEEK
jgi:hypothetical protein